MIVMIKLRTTVKGNNELTQEDIQINIDALQRAIDGKPQAMDSILHIATKSILEGIKRQLPPNRKGYND